MPFLFAALRISYHWNNSKSPLKTHTYPTPHESRGEWEHVSRQHLIPLFALLVHRLPLSGCSLYNPVITHQWVNHGPPNNRQFIPPANFSHPVVQTIVWSSSTPQPHSGFLSGHSGFLFVYASSLRCKISKNNKIVHLPRLIAFGAIKGPRYPNQFIVKT